MKVRCIGKLDTDWLVVGEVYEVLERRVSDSAWLRLHFGTHWVPERWFEAVPDEPEARKTGEATMKLSKEKWTLVGHRHEHEVYACLNSQGATCWYINHAGHSEAELNDGRAVAPLYAYPGEEPLGFRPLAWSPAPDEPEAEPCLCNSDRGPRSCPEHGVRCHNPDCDKLCDGPDAWNSRDADDRTVHWCSESCWRERHFAKQPKVDKYEAHRLKSWGDDVIRSQMVHSDLARGATARLLRGLESEKVRERGRPFPKQGRNFELKGKR